MSNEKFRSKSGFILASIGAAVGLGNALRFPGLCAKYGGGSFLFVYLIALIVLGVPVLNAEIALGRKLKSGAPDCMQSLAARPMLAKPAAAVGWASGFNSVITAIIYAGLAGWIISAAFNIVPLAINAPSLNQTQISEHFFQNVLNARNDGVISGVSPLVLACIAAAWVLMFFCLKGGAGSLAKAAKFTVIIPVTLLIIMAGRGLMHETSPQALAALFVPDLSKLSSPDLWITALGQVFFSLSVAVGIMPVYGSYLPEKTNIFSCSLAIAAADFLVSVLASVVLFTTLYGCGLENSISPSGIITAFAVYPAAITRLFGNNPALNSIAGVLFYSSLAMMAVQSAVSMLEAFVSPYSSRRGKNKKSLVIRICAIGGVISAVFATTAAPIIVDIADRFVNFYNVLALAVAETFLIAFSRKIPDISAEINKFAKNGSKLRLPQKALAISVKHLCTAVLSALCAMEIYRLATNGLSYPFWLLAPFGWGLSLLVIASAIFLAFPRPRLQNSLKPPKKSQKYRKKLTNSQKKLQFFHKFS